MGLKKSWFEEPYLVYDIVVIVKEYWTQITPFNLQSFTWKRLQLKSVNRQWTDLHTKKIWKNDKRRTKEKEKETGGPWIMADSDLGPFEGFTELCWHSNIGLDKGVMCPMLFGAFCGRILWSLLNEPINLKLSFPFPSGRFWICSVADLSPAMVIKRYMLIRKSCICDTA